MAIALMHNIESAPEESLIEFDDIPTYTPKQEITLQGAVRVFL
jgi:hypothetical protein